MFELIFKFNHKDQIEVKFFDTEDEMYSFIKKNDIEVQKVEKVLDDRQL